MPKIVSSLPGRLRIRHCALQSLAVQARCSALFAALPEVITASGNPRAGSITVQYALDGRPAEVIAAEIGALAARELAGCAAAEQGTEQACPARSSAGGLRLNRFAKRSMLASLSTSLLLAATGNKRWHAISGGLFVAGLAVHLYTHRRHILR